MFLARIVFFRLHESPRYLVHAGRPLEAIESLQMISAFNGDELSLDPEDVDDTMPASATRPDPSNPPAGTDEEAQKRVPTLEASSEALRASPKSGSSYNSVGRPDVSLDGHEFGTPLPGSGPVSPHFPFPPPTPLSEERQALMSPSREERRDPLPPAVPRPPRSRQGSSAARSSRRLSRRMSTASTYIESKSGPLCGMLPRWMRRSALAWVDRVAMVLSPEWMRTTLLVWAAWCGMSLGERRFAGWFVCEDGADVRVFAL